MNLLVTGSAGHLGEALVRTLRAEGHDVRYRNIWIKELDLRQADTDFRAAD